jgi:hypothetical protein
MINTVIGDGYSFIRVNRPMMFGMLFMMVG